MTSEVQEDNASSWLRRLAAKVEACDNEAAFIMRHYEGVLD